MAEFPLFPARRSAAHAAHAPRAAAARLGLTDS